MLSLTPGEWACYCYVSYLGLTRISLGVVSVGWLVTQSPAPCGRVRFRAVLGFLLLLRAGTWFRGSGSIFRLVSATASLIPMNRRELLGLLRRKKGPRDEEMQRRRGEGMSLAMFAYRTNLRQPTYMIPPLRPAQLQETSSISEYNISITYIYKYPAST